ncbi:CHAP domain-containing protein [Sphingorhabdus lutea]
MGILLCAATAMSAAIIPSVAAHALNEGLQCVPYARALSGINIYGDAHTWWGQAEGKYKRNNRPDIGAVMAFKPHGVMQLGHVAAVSKIIDKRTILISHANWSTINGTRGHIEDNVKAIDVSEKNDWSLVRIWYSPIDNLGGSEYPIHGFIHPNSQNNDRDIRLAVANLTGKTPSHSPILGKKGKKNEDRPSVRMADARPEKSKKQENRAQTSFTLSASTLRDAEYGARHEKVNKAAAQKKSIAEPQHANEAPRKKDEIGDLLAQIGAGN